VIESTKERMMIDVDPTAAAIDVAANNFRYVADRLESIATKMRERNDITYASEAVSEIVNAISNSRIDLLVTRPIRAFQTKD
jgi:hypothetical protein